MRVTFVAEGKNTVLLADGKPVGRVIAGEGTEDFFTVEEGAVCWTRKCREPADHMVMEVEGLFPAEHTLVPAVSYDGNPWGNDHEHKGYEKDGIPWTYAHHRTAAAGATASMGEDTGLAVYGEGEASGSIFIRDGYAVHRVIWPETEEPFVLMAYGFEPPFHGSMEPSSRFRAWIFPGGTGKEASWKRMLSHAWNRAYSNRVCRNQVYKNQASGSQECRKQESGDQTYDNQGVCRNAEEVWELSADYARLLYTEEEDGFHGFSIGLCWDGENWTKREDLKYEIGWCGQNASLAVSLLYDHQMYGRQESLEKAISVLDSWVHKARSREGFLLTRYDPEDSLIDACNLGTAGWQFFEAYEQAKRLGMDKPEYWDAAMEICSFIMERQRLDGGIGMSWNRDGSVHELKGTAGAFLILPLAEAFLRTGESRFNVAAVRAYSYYYREFQKNGYGTSGALDTCCIDKESVIPLLKGGILMYRATGFEKYLDMAEDAAWYLSTWQYHQSVVYPKDSTLARLSYDTFGGTAVSTSHHHMDPFALCYGADLDLLGEYTGREQWKQRALAIWRNGIQGISDGTLQVMPTGVRPKGSSDEGYLHTRWGGDGKSGWGNSFDVSQWLVAWPCAFRLEALRRFPDWNLLEGKRGSL